MRIAFLATAIAIYFLTAFPSVAIAGGWWSQPKPVELKVVQPRFSFWSVPVQRGSGWAITLEMTARNELGIASYSGFPPFPGRAETGYVVFEDPNGCPEYFPSVITPTSGCIPGPVPDETYLEFTPDIDLPGVIDFSGNDTLRMNQIDSLDGVPQFNTLDPAGVPSTDRLGPLTGMEVVDGFGVSTPDDDLPGLVVLSPTGIGLVLDENFDPPAVPTLRNLAGLVSSVSYELSDWTRRTTVTAHINIPEGAIAPAVKIDNCVGGPTCDQPSLWRIDGGPVVSAGSNDSVFQTLYPQLFDSLTYEIRVFVVSGTAPGTLADENGDGIVNRHDATAAGYDVISAERKIRVRQIFGDPCFNGNQVLLEDFDGNGETSLGAVCPAGSGSISTVPR